MEQNVLNHNRSYTIGKALLVGSVFSVATLVDLTGAYALVTKPIQPAPVYIMTPFTVDEINIKKEQATLSTANDEYSLEVEFDAEYFMDGNGVGHNWRDVEVKEIKDIHVFSEDGEIQAYIDRLDIVEIKDIIEQELRERTSALRGERHD